MNQTFIEEELVNKIKEYAKGRTRCVEMGLETPKFAALLLQKYGYGIADAGYVLRDNGIDISCLYKIVDEEVGKIDSNWREHAKERWEGKPADIVNLSENEN